MCVTREILFLLIGEVVFCRVVWLDAFDNISMLCWERLRDAGRQKDGPFESACPTFQLEACTSRGSEGYFLSWISEASITEYGFFKMPSSI